MAKTKQAKQELTGELAATLAKLPVQEIELAKIRDDGKRLDSPAERAKLEAMGESLKRDGQLQAILVYRHVSGQFGRVFGSRRCAAARVAGLATIAAHVMPGAPSTAQVEKLRALENMQRRDFSAAEEALQLSHAVAAWQGHADNRGGVEGAIKRVAAEQGISEKRVRDCLYVIERLAPRTLEILAVGGINLGHARALTKLGDQGRQAKIAEEIAVDAQPDEESAAERNAGTSYMAQTRGRLWSVQEVENVVAQEKHSLRSVSWSLTVAMKTGVAGCAVCVGCRHNTATDATLFGTSKDEMFAVKDGEEDGEAMAGCCTNPAGFAAKQAMTQKGMESGTKKAREQIKGKKIEKAQAAGIEVISEVMPEYVKPAAGQRFVKRELGIGDAKAGSNGTAGGEKGGEKKVDSERRRRENAVVKWGAAHEAWTDGIARHIQAMFEKNTLAALAWLMLSKIAIPEFSFARQSYQAEGKKQPEEEKALTPGHSKNIDEVAEILKGDLSAIKNLAEEMDLWAHWSVAIGFHHTSRIRLSAGPELAMRLAKVFGVTVEKPAPRWEDFYTAVDMPAAKQSK